MRSLTIGALAGVSMAISALPALADAATTRIEPRPFYGATVTLEEGVRVFRPLPRHDRVIINPNNAPVYLGFNESHSYNYGPNQAYSYDRSADGYPVGLWGPSGNPRGVNRHRGHRPRAGGIGGP
jgi:hypothetical protein